MSHEMRGRGPVVRPPHPATVQKKGLPPHPATVAQPKSAWVTGARMPPHPATVVQPRLSPVGLAALPPHPATFGKSSPPHPARLAAAPTAVQRAKKTLGGKELVVTGGPFAGHYQEEEWDQLVSDLHEAGVTTVIDATNLKSNLGKQGMYVFDNASSVGTWTKKLKSAVDVPEPIKKNKRPGNSTLAEYDAVKRTRYRVREKTNAWLDYTKDFHAKFTLTQVISIHEDEAKPIHCVSNIGEASDWLKAAQGIKAADGWDAVRSVGLKAYSGSKPASKLTHTGIMLAQVTTSLTHWLFVCGASNYHQSLVDTDEPWMFTGVSQELGEGTDMHTERFCLVQLYDWIHRLGLEPHGTIQIVWVLEKEMCTKACVPVLELFTGYWDAQNIKVGSTVVESNAYFNKNMNLALKNFAQL